MKLALITFIAVLVALFALVNGVPTEEKQNGKKVICYYTNWSAYRSGNSRYTPSDIDTSLCTHIIYSFAILNANSLEMVVQDQETDINMGFYEQVTALKQRGVNVSIAIGGWGDSRGDKYSRMVNNGQSRANFVTKAVQFLQRYNFDGLDLDWEYPKCWQADCSAGPASDKANFVNLVRELKTAFTPHSFLLSAAVAAARSTAGQAYDVPALASQLDWIGLMNYDYHGGWDGATGHNSPFRGPAPNTVDTVSYWLDNGAPASKLVIGVPLYARSFTLANPNNNGVGDRATDGRPGQYTTEAGFLAYFEFCAGYTFTHVPNVGPYGYGVGTNNRDQWVSYDDIQIIEQKAQYVKDLGLAGAMIWAIDLDDFRGDFCFRGRYPLLTALRNALN